MYKSIRYNNKTNNRINNYITITTSTTKNNNK